MELAPLALGSCKKQLDIAVSEKANSCSPSEISQPGSCRWLWDLFIYSSSWLLKDSTPALEPFF